MRSGLLLLLIVGLGACHDHPPCKAPSVCLANPVCLSQMTCAQGGSVSLCCEQEGGEAKFDHCSYATSDGTWYPCATSASLPGDGGQDDGGADASVDGGVSQDCSDARQRAQDWCGERSP
jgi:hypothetical protein